MRALSPSAPPLAAPHAPPLAPAASAPPPAPPAAAPVIPPRPEGHGAAVRAMFAAIAPRYDRANEVLSLGIHRLWRARAIRLLAPRPGERILDLACGTGDLALAIARRVAPTGRVVGADFCEPMLAGAARRRAAQGFSPATLPLVGADAQSLPFARGAFDGATIAFGIRNVTDPLAALRELRRVLRPRGRLVVLELGQPWLPLVREGYEVAARHVMPLVGGLLTGVRAAYEYLPRTQSAFPSGARFVRLLEAAGFHAPRAIPLTLGIAWAYATEVPS